MKLTKTKLGCLSALAIGCVCILGFAVPEYRWRTAGEDHDEFHWTEEDHAGRCKAVHIPGHQESAWGVHAFAATTGPLRGGFLFAPCPAMEIPRVALEYAQQYGFVRWNPVNGSVMRVSYAELDPRQLADVQQSSKDSCVTDSESYVDCAGTRLPVTPQQWTAASHKFWARADVSPDSQFAAVVSMDEIQMSHTGLVILSPIDFFTAPRGDFRLNIYRLPDRRAPIVSIRGSYIGNQFDQANYASTLEWIANRYVIFRAGVNTQEYCICDLNWR